MFWREAALDPCPAHPPLTWVMIPKNLPLHHLFSSPHAEVNFMRKSKRLSLMLSMAPISFFLMLLVHVRADPFSSSSSSSSCLDQFSSWNLQALSYAQPRSSFSSWWCYLWSLSCFLSPFKRWPWSCVWPPVWEFLGRILLQTAPVIFLSPSGWTKSKILKIQKYKNTKNTKI